MLCFKSINLSPSSIIPEIDGHFSNLMTDHQTNVVGILGGYSSLSFAKRLVEQEVELPFILCTDPSLSNDLLSLDRSSSPFPSCKPAVEALSMKDFEGAQNLVRIALQLLLIRSVNRIVLACDELRELLPPHDPLWTICIDPTDALARLAIQYAWSADKES